MKTKRFSIEADLNDYEIYMNLKEEFDCSHAQLLRYLLSLENSKVSKGGAVVEQKLKQWLILGYKEVISVHALRYANYKTNKVAGMATVQKIYDLYKEDIELHNSKIPNKLI
jgi:hypothetical protein